MNTYLIEDLDTVMALNEKIAELEAEMDSAEADGDADAYSVACDELFDALDAFEQLAKKSAKLLAKSGQTIDAKDDEFLIVVDELAAMQLEDELAEAQDELAMAYEDEFCF